MTTYTPSMGLELPTIVGLKNIGTLPQDWALILNSNITLIDGHDHAILGNPVLSSNMIIGSDINVNEVAINSLEYVAFATYDNTQNVSLYCDGTDLFWQDLEGNIVQITKAGGLNVTADIGGFFGDYGSANAYAFLDGAGGYYGFRGIAPTYSDNSKIVLGDLVFDESVLSTPLIQLNVPLSSKFITPGKLILSNAPFINRSIVTHENTGLRFSSVYGDGSVYADSFPSVPITDPNGIIHVNEQYQDRINPNVLVNMSPNTKIDQNHSIEIFANMQKIGLVGDYVNFQPGEVKTFSIYHSFPLMEKIPHWDGQFSVNLCKWVLNFPKSFVTGQGINPLYKKLKANIISVSQVTNGQFIVVGSLTNITDISIELPPNTELMGNLRIAAIFPLFNGQGVFFGEQY